MQPTKTQKAIMQYLAIESKGFISLSAKQADKIISIVQSHLDGASVQVSKYNHIKNGFQLIRTIATTDACINNQIMQALNMPQNVESIRYDCYNSNQQFEGTIYTTNPHLFD